MARKRYQAKQAQKAEVFEALTEIFKAVADYVDGGCYDEDITEIVNAYETAMKHPHVLEFYGELVDQRSIEVFGETS